MSRSDLTRRRLQERDPCDCIDAMIWIGSGPKGYPAVEDYLRESQLRGCCRLIPCIQPWMRWGLSRIFLAHRDTHTSSDRGAIIGYFILNRTEHVDNGDGPPPPDDESWPEPEKPDTHPPGPIPPPQPGPGQPPKPVPQPTPKWEAPRLCGQRKSGKDYLIDALCAAIHDLYQDLIGKELGGGNGAGRGRRVTEILQQLRGEIGTAWSRWLDYSRQNQDWTIEELLAAYRGPFRDAVRAFYLDWRPRFKPDRRLAGKVTIRGDVFVFNKPFPILERAPQVSFRGLWRINGDSLIEQIGKHRSRKRLIVTVHSCGPGACPLPDAIVTKQQLADCLATGVRLNRSFVDHFLSELATTARVQLLHHRRFKLPGIGTLLIRGSRDPSVRFQPSTRMWRSQRSQRRGRARAGLCFYSYKNIAQTAKMRKRGKPLKEIKLLSELLLSLANRLAVRRGRSPIKATQSALTRRYQPLVKRLYDGLRALAQDELKRGNDFRLPAIGRFSIGSH